MARVNTREVAMGFWIAAGFAVFGIILAVGRSVLSKAVSAA